MKKKLLKYDDVIIFTIDDIILKYRVSSDHLCRIGGENNIIFEKLNIIDRYLFCSNYYEYCTNSGDFPFCKNNDYEALTKVYNALQDLCNKHNGIIKTITYEIY